MVGTSVVPDSDVVLLPLESRLQIVVLGDVSEQIVENAVALLWVKLYDSGGERFVDEEALPLRNRVCADYRAEFSYKLGI